MSSKPDMSLALSFVVEHGRNELADDDGRSEIEGAPQALSFLGSVGDWIRRVYRFKL